MRKFLTLTKFLLKSGPGMAAVSKNGKGKNRSILGTGSKTLLLYVILAVCMIPLAVALYQLGQGLYVVFTQINLPELPIQLICYAGSFVILFFGIPYVISVFFLSSDVETLLPLPFAPWQIVAAKFTVVLVYEYLIVIFFILPPFVGYGVASGNGILFWFFLLFIIILLPIIPLIYASLLGIVMMRLLKNVKNKENITTMGSVILLVLIMGINVLLRSNQGDITQLVDIIAANQSLLEKINILFPNLFFAGSALTDLNLFAFLGFVLVVGAFVLLFLFVSQKMYLGGVLGMQESTSKRRMLTKEERHAFAHQKNPITTYAWKEFKMLFRTPIYFLNCLMMPVIFPLLICITSISSILSSSKEGSGLNMIPAVIDAIPPDIINGLLLIVIYGLSILVGSTNLTTTTCISREGQGYIFMKYIPLSYRDQFRAKVINGYVISIAASLPYVIIALMTAVVMFGVHPFILIVGIAVNMLSLLLVNYIQLWSDLANPKLIWENEQSAVKQNFAAAVTMFGLMVLGFLIGMAAVFCYTKLHIMPMLIAVIFLVLMGVITWFIRNMVYRFGARKLENMES